MKHYTAYIDEAGDEGIGKLASGSIGGQSRWLVIGACIVDRETDLQLPKIKDRIISRFPNKKQRDLHFRELRHDQKIVVCQEISQQSVKACVVLSHKITLIGTKYERIFKQKGYLYNYLVRWLLERVTTDVFNNSGSSAVLRVIFSRRGGTNYQKMREYMLLMRDGREQIPPLRRIRWEVLNIDDIKVENHSKWAGLQIADCITSAFFNAVEPNIYGNYESSYANILKSKLISQNGNPMNCGFVPVPHFGKCGTDDRQMAFFKSHIGK